jgi:hypothetical protein
MNAKSNSTGLPQRENGAVTLLDVLGWKGIWQQDSAALDTLHGLILETKKKAEAFSTQYSDIPEFRGKSEITNILSISDTIAMFTTGSAEKTIEIQAEICAWLLEYALSQKIPLRGAISYGKYMIKENIMLGYAVDEAASWYEATDWIGVILTPSAQISIRNKTLPHIITYSQIPFKIKERNLVQCVDWKFGDETMLYDVIIGKGPHTPEIAPKYLNTLAFLDREHQRLQYNGL